MMNLCILYCNTLSIDISLWMFQLQPDCLQRCKNIGLLWFTSEKKQCEAIDDTPPVDHQKVVGFYRQAHGLRKASVTGFTGFSRLLKVPWLAMVKRAKQKWVVYR